MRGAAGLYLHIPFCSAICPYCDFAVRTGRPPARERFVGALLAEIRLSQGSPLAFDTVHLGGGTPSILEPEQLGAIIAAVRGNLRVERDARISMEANPEDVSEANVAVWRELGVGTLTLGVQSFDDGELRFLGRRHRRQRALDAVEVALAAGFSTVGIDLIYGLPDQAPAAWRRSLETAIGLGLEHLSCYQLTLTEGTHYGRRLAQGRLHEMPEDDQAELFFLTHRLLAGGGFGAYEVSNFARAPAHRSSHNRKYWEYVPYLGLGPSAHSFDGRRRWWNDRAVADYEGRVEAGEHPVAGEETLTREELALEALMLRLRTPEGIDLKAFREGHGIDLLGRGGATLERAAAGGLLTIAGGRLRPTLEGMAVADRLAVDVASDLAVDRDPPEDSVAGRAGQPLPPKASAVVE